MAVVIKPFAYAADGIHVVKLAPGDERDFGASTAGLVAEGYVSADVAKSVEAVAEETAAEEVQEAHPFDHDGDGNPGGSLPKSRRRK